MALDAVADAFQKIGVPYSTSADVYSSTTIGAAAVPIELASVDNYAVGNGLPAALPSGVNLFQKTSDFTDAYWTKIASSIVPNVAVAPDGTLTADKLVEDTTVGSHSVQRAAIPNTLGLPYSFSIYAKPAGRNFLLINPTDAGWSTGSEAYFNLLTGASFTGGLGTVRCVPVGDGWYRCMYAGLNGTGTVGTVIFGPIASFVIGQTPAYQGDGASGLLLWGAQFEQSALFSDYTPVA